MKKIKQNYNLLLLRYNRFVKKLRRLQLLGQNTHRQNVLQKHILRTGRQLQNLQLQINKKVAFTAAITVFTVIGIQAQGVFDVPIQNPFNIEVFDEVFADKARPVFADIDGDGDLDMLSGGYYGTFVFYENTGTVNNPDFQSPIINPFDLGTIELPGSQTPTLVDIDGDGDYDVLSSLGGVVLGDPYHQAFLYYENIGTTMEPNFDAAQMNPFGIPNIGSYNGHTFADIDNDGDFDLFNNNTFFENIGSPQVPNFTTGQEEFLDLDLPSLGYYTSLSFADLDNDGDLDLLLGGYGGYYYGGFLYFENIGSSIEADFASPIEGFLGLDHMNNYRIQPSFVDLDNDGDLDIMFGIAEGDFFYIENIPDDLPPIPDLDTLPDINAQCEVLSLTPPTATDNTNVEVTVTNDASLPITNQGTTLITWTFTDVNDNSTTQAQNIVIEDTLAPTIDCPVDEDVIIAGDEAIDYLLEDFSVSFPIADNCNEFDELNVTQDPPIGTSLANPSITEVTLSVTDLVGNEQTCAFTIVVDETLSINDASLNSNAIRFFPNPVKNQLSVITEDLSLQSAQVYDLAGRLIQDYLLDNNLENQIDLTHLSSGMYLITFQTTTNNTIIRQILKE